MKKLPETVKFGVEIGNATPIRRKSERIGMDITASEARLAPKKEPLPHSVTLDQNVFTKKVN